MPVGEIAGELLGGLFKFIGRLFIEVVIELIIKGSGYIICRMFSKNVDPDGVLVILVGLIFIGMVGWGIYFVYDYVQLQLAIDHCLESGGEYAEAESNNAGLNNSEFIDSEDNDSEFNDTEDNSDKRTCQ